MEALSLARSRKLQEHIWEWGELQLQERLSGSRSLSWLPASGARDLKWAFVTAAFSLYVDRGTAGDHEVFEDTDWESQDLVRLEAQWASSFGSASS